MGDRPSDLWFSAAFRAPVHPSRWRVTVRNEFWVACCDLTSSIRFEDPASAEDAALDHIRTCREARRG